MKKAISRFRFTLFLLLPLMYLATVSGSVVLHTAQAQGAERDHVDVALILEELPESNTGRELYIIVVNHGDRTAYDVEVVVDIAYPETSTFFHSVSDAPIGRASVGSGGYSIHWTIPALGGLQRAEVLGDIIDKHSVRNFDKSEYIHKFVGEVTTSSFESNLHQANNQDRAWSVAVNPGDNDNEPAWSTYSVNVSVDERNPSPGDIVNFTITANTRGRFAVIDQEVAIELTDGLAVDEDANADPPREISYAPDDRADSVSYSNDVFNIGTLTYSDYNGSHSVTLPVRVSSNAAVNEQCLTATISGNPPPGNGPRDDDVSDNVAKVCLGEPPGEAVVFTREQTDLFTWYDCVGKSSYPCSSEDSLEFVVLGMSASAASDAPYGIFEPENVIIHIPDPVGRNTSSDSNSDALVWSTGFRDDPNVNGDERFAKSGVYVGDNQTLLAPGKWGVEPSGEAGERTGHLVVTVSGPGAASFWGIYDAGSNYEAYPFFNEATNGEMYNDVWYLQYRSEVYGEFGALGTYTLTLQGTANLNAGTPGDDSDDTAHTTTGTYTFHVGAMADLMVEDGGTSPHVAEDRNALMIVAANGGPSSVGGAQVTGLPTGATLAYISNGTYDSARGEWDIGELKTRDYYRSAGRLEEAVLVLIASSGDSATVTISNEADYTVCISSDGDTLTHTNQTDCEADTAAGGSWHTESVYDYNDDNNTATITARAGTGGVGEGIPTLQAPAVHTPAVGFEWDEIDYLYGTPVKHYETEWSADGESGWTQLKDEISITEHVDTEIQAGVTRYYRVRAVNEAGVPGPWSAPMLAMPIDTSVPGITISETELTIREGQSAQYTVTLHSRPHSNVTVRINGGGAVSPSPGTLTFNTIDFNMPKTVELTGIQDNNPDNEQVNVTHTISSGDTGYESLTPDPVAVTVIDDDSGVSVTAVQESVNEGDAIDFTLTRTGNIDSAIMVDLSVSQRGNFLPADQLGARSVSIGANVATQTVTVRTDNDTVVESPGSVTLAVNSGTGSDYLVGAPRTATVEVTDDDGPPGQPGELAAEELDERVTLTWAAAPSSSSAVERYQVRWRGAGGPWSGWAVIPGSGSARSHTVRNLTNGVAYTFEVRARNGTGDGPAAQVAANPRAAPDAPGVEVHARSGSLLVTWNVSDDGGRDITEYQVQWKSGGQSFDTTRQATVTTAAHTIPSLTNGTEYRVRARAENEAGWSPWSTEVRGTPAPRPDTSLRITTDARDGVSAPFRVTFTFTDQDHDGTRYGVEGFSVDDIEAWYSTAGYEFALKDFRAERAGFVYSARVEDMLDGELTIQVPAGAATSTGDGQLSTAAEMTITVDVPEDVAPVGTEIWAAEMTVGEFDGNALGYIDRARSAWQGSGKIGSLDDDGFSYGGTNHTVGEVSYVSAWSTILFSVCPGIAGANAAFDLHLDDQVDGNEDVTLSFDSDEVETSEFSATVGGVTQTCVEYSWQPTTVDWEKDGKVNVRLVR